MSGPLAPVCGRMSSRREERRGGGGGAAEGSDVDKARGQSPGVQAARSMLCSALNVRSPAEGPGRTADAGGSLCSPPLTLPP